MSEAQPTTSGGKIGRDKRRRSSDPPVPYKKPTRQSMPTTRRSPARARDPSPPETEAPGDVLKELILLRRSIETKFLESAAKADNTKAEILSKLESNDQAVSELQLSVADVTLSVDRNQRSIQEVRAEVERSEVQLPGRVREIVNEALNRQSTAGVRPRALGSPGPLDRILSSAPAALPPAGGRDEAFSTARRSFRLWPVSREGDLKERTLEFMVNELLLDQQYATSLEFTVKRVGRRRAGDAPAGAVRDEVLLTFATCRKRDDVRSYARNLERKGRGLRLEVPEHLWPSFRLLQNLAYELKLKNPELKRNILFDDLAANLKMDVCFVADEWRTITPKEAKLTLAKCRPAKSGRDNMTSSELEGLLSGTGEERMEEEREF